MKEAGVSDLREYFKLHQVRVAGNFGWHLVIAGNKLRIVFATYEPSVIPMSQITLKWQYGRIRFRTIYHCIILHSASAERL